MKNILVTGSAGFIASHLIEELLKDENNSIIGIDNFYSGTKENLEFIKSIDKENRFQFIEVDIRNFEEINKIIRDKKIEYIYQDRKSTRLNSSHLKLSRMPSSA